MSDAHRVLAIIFGITVAVLIVCAAAFGAPRAGEIIPIPVDPRPLMGLHQYELGSPPPARPTRRPDHAFMVGRCPDDIEDWIMEGDAPEERGFFHVGKDGTIEYRPFFIVHWDREGMMDIGWYKGQTYTRETFIGRFPIACDAVKDR